MLQGLREWFWQDWVWFPPGLGWADLENRDGKVFGQSEDLWVTLPIALCFLIIRQVFEWTVATPLASLLGVREKARVHASHNPLLESYFRSTTKHPTLSALESLSKKSGLSERQVHRWFRRRRNQERPNKLKKFRRPGPSVWCFFFSWRFTFYLLAFIAGLAVLVDKPWFYKKEEMWKDFPKMPLLESQYWYYMIELGFYISLLFSVATDVKRKDFKEQIIHHVATILLISFSWLVNYIRAGTMIMLIHDAADYLLESGKMFNYAGWRKTCNYLFIVFAVVFFITRLILFPFWIMHATIVYPLSLYPTFFGYYFFNGLLVVLQCLHIFWFGLIMRMAIKFLPGNKIVEDERSDRDETDDSEDEGEENEGKTKNGPVRNGHAVLNNNHRKMD